MNRKLLCQFVGVIMIIISPIIVGRMVVESYGHPHFPNNQDLKTPDSACKYTVYYKKGGDTQYKIRAHKISLLNTWLMIYSCEGSNKKAVYIPERRVLWIEFK